MGRVINITASLVLLFFLSPVLIAVSALVLVKMGSPVFFIQRRPGFKGRPFMMYKFRTMSTPSACGSESDAARITPFGSFLRKASLDELPELINVLRGDMSLVGPRPLLMEYLPLYSDSQRRRMDVDPGITGWAQINGRNRLSWQDKFDMDIWYVDNKTVWLDLKILWKTVHSVMARKDISQAGFVGAEKFKGNKQ